MLPRLKLQLKLERSLTETRTDSSNWHNSTGLLAQRTESVSKHYSYGDDRDRPVVYTVDAAWYISPGK